MSPIRLVILGLMLVFGVWAARRRGQRWYLFLAVAALLGLGLQLMMFWHRVSQPKLDFFDLLGAVLVAFLAAEALGLPPPLARRLRIGLYSREWEYDRRLTALGRRIDQLFRANPGASDAVAYGTWRNRLASEGARLVAALRRMHPPDERWQALTDQMARHYEEIVAAARNPEVRPDAESWNRQAAQIQDRWETLRHAYHDRDAFGSKHR